MGNITVNRTSTPCLCFLLPTHHVFIKPGRDPASRDSHKLICPGHGAPQSMAYSFTSVGNCLYTSGEGAPSLYEISNNAKGGVTRVRHGEHGSRCTTLLVCLKWSRFRRFQFISERQPPLLHFTVYRLIRAKVRGLHVHIQ